MIFREESRPPSPLVECPAPQVPATCHAGNAGRMSASPDDPRDQHEVIRLVHQERHQARPAERQRPQRPLRLTRPALVLRRVHDHDSVHEVSKRDLHLRRQARELAGGQVLQLPPEHAQALSCAPNSPLLTRCPGPGSPPARYRSIRARKSRWPAGSRCPSSASIHHRRTAVVSTVRSPVSRACANAASSSASYWTTISGTALAASTARIVAGVPAGRPAAAGSCC